MAHRSEPPRHGKLALSTAVVLGIAGLAAIALAGHQPTLVAQGTAPDYGKEVAPVLYRNCAGCHRPGGIGPFSVLDADSVKAYAKDIREAVNSGYMPPWHAEGPRGVFTNDRRLSDLDRLAILRWVEDGAKLGDRKAHPAAPAFNGSWEFGTPDAVFTMNEPFTVPATGTVEYQYFEVPTNFTEDKWVQAIEILPGSREVVHHVLVYARPPQTPAPAPAAATPSPAPSGAPSGAPVAARPAPKPPVEFDENNRFEDPPRKDPRNAPPMRVGNLIGTTAPGTNVVRFPEGTALRVRAGTTLVFQMHYTAHGHETADRTSVGFQFAKTPPAEQVIASNFLNGKFTLPAGKKDVMVPSTITINEPIKIYGLFPHTHLRGTRWQYTLEKPDGTSEIILDVPRYDFNWQTYYMFAKPLDIPAGAKITMQYTGFLFSVNSRRLRP